MNFKRDQNGGPILDMKQLAKRIDDQVDEFKSHDPLKYAPPSARHVVPVLNVTPAISSFGELPTKEIDEIIEAAKAELADLERHGDVVKQMYAQHVEEIRLGIERLREGIRLSMSTFNELREQCKVLNAGPKAPPPE